MKISVITVCYNAAQVIEKTMKSVLEQSHADMEYIIIDGASTDGTVEKIQALQKEHTGIQLTSEPDRGIYDAMNKGIQVASGDYVHFLNAGDTFSDNGVISKTVDVINETRAEIVYGDIIYCNPDGSMENRQYGESCAKKLYYLTGDCINHQAMLVKRELFEAGDFDLSYKICADREWMMRQSKAGVSFYAMHFPVCNFALDGASLVQKDVYNAEAKRCIRQHFPMGYPLFACFEFMRNNRILSGLLHGIYRVIFIRKN